MQEDWPAQWRAAQLTQEFLTSTCREMPEVGGRDWRNARDIQLPALFVLY